MGGRRKSKRSAKSENVEPMAVSSRPMRSAGSSIPVCVKRDDQVPVQREVKKSVGVLNKGRDSESWRRRPLSVLDKNRGESVTSAADLSDSVFADARCTF